MEFLTDFAQFLIDLLLYIPRVVFDALLSALASLLEALPPPQALTVWAAGSSQIPSAVIWFLDLLQFRAGVSLVFGALTLRFLIRRIPFIG